MVTVGEFRQAWRDEGLVLALIRACRTVAPRGADIHFLFAIEEGKTFGSYDLSLTERLDLYRHGFLSQASVLYDFEEYGPESYLSEFQRLRTMGINSPFTEIINNKYIFHQLLSNHTDRHPELYGYVDDGTIWAEGSAAISDDSPPGALLDEYDTFVTKPIKGGGGASVSLCRSQSDGCVINGERLSRAEFAEWLQDLDECVITEYIDQGEYAATFYPETPNTLRILTMIDPDTKEPFIARAVQRMGSERSGHLDNWSAGGLAANITSDGRLGPGVAFPDEGDLVYHERHPDTGAQIKGVQVPEWELISTEILDVVDAIGLLPYVGWDVLPTDDGYQIIEGNHFTGVGFQVDEPLLIDDRIRRFYEYHGIV